MLCYNPCSTCLCLFLFVVTPYPCQVEGTPPPTYPAILRRLRHLIIIFVGPFAVFPFFLVLLTFCVFLPPLGPSVSVLSVLFV